MQRIFLLTLAAGVAATGLWALLRGMRSRAGDRDLGSVSEAWLNDPRGNIHRLD